MQKYVVVSIFVDGEVALVFGPFDSKDKAEAWVKNERERPDNPCPLGIELLVKVVSPPKGIEKEFNCNVIQPHLYGAFDASDSRW